MLVCFDLGGVLIRIRYSWRDACAAAGLPVHPQAVAAAETPAFFRLLDALQCGALGYSDFLESARTLLGGAYAPRELGRIHAAILHEEMPRAAQLVDSLHQRGVATAILSNTNAAHCAVFRSWPAVARVGTALLSQEIGAIKPDRRAFAAVEAKTGARGTSVLFFDDTATNVQAARAFGWRAEQIDPSQDTVLQMQRHLAAHGLRLRVSA